MTEKISVREAAKRLKKCHQYIRAFIEAGKLKAWRNGGTKDHPRLIIDFDELLEVIAHEGEVPKLIRYIWKEYKPFVFVQWAVYFLLKNEKVMYVGQSKLLHRRVADHYANGDGKDFDKVFYVEPYGVEPLDLETALILLMRPPLNIRVSTRMYEPMDPILVVRECHKYVSGRIARGQQ